ncbi:MAG: hypothetical protein ACKVHP_09645 [Verrucomicrobiales bacterium]
MSKKSNKSKGYSAGLDIGGTTIKAMLVDSAGDQVGELVEVQSRVDEGYTKTFGQLKEALGAILKGGGLGMDDLAVIGLDVSHAPEFEVWAALCRSRHWPSRWARSSWRLHV